MIGAAEGICGARRTISLGCQLNVRPHRVRTARGRLVMNKALVFGAAALARYVQACQRIATGRLSNQSIHSCACDFVSKHLSKKGRWRARFTLSYCPTSLSYCCFELACAVPVKSPATRRVRTAQGDCN